MVPMGFVAIPTAPNGAENLNGWPGGPHMGSGGSAAGPSVMWVPASMMMVPVTATSAAPMSPSLVGHPVGVGVGMGGNGAEGTP